MTTRKHDIGDSSRAVETGDVASVRKIWSEDSEVVSRVGLTLNVYLRNCASAGDYLMISVLVELGADINYSRDFYDHVLSSAADSKSMPCLRWLLANGANVNMETADGTRSPALESAVFVGSLEMVELLVDHGAIINYEWENSDKPCGNPLTSAIKSGHDDIIKYLRSQGGVEPERVIRTSGDPLDDHIRQHFGVVGENSVDQIEPTDPPITISIARNADFSTLFTKGMSSVPVKQNDGTEQFVELLLQVPAGWPLHPGTEDPGVWWGITCLQDTAVFPHETGQPFSFYVLFPNGTPPTAIYEDSSFTGVMAIQVMGPAGGFQDGTRTITLYHMIPLYTEEFQLVETDGIEALLQRFQDEGIGQHLDSGRKNVGVE